MEFETFILYAQLFYQKNPDAPQEGLVLILDKDDYANVAVHSEQSSRIFSFGEILPYDESGISGCLVKQLTNPHIFGLHTFSPDIAREICKMGRVEFRDTNNPYKINTMGKNYWII